MAQFYYLRAITAFWLGARLETICRASKVLQIKIDKKNIEDIADELCVIVCQHVAGFSYDKTY